MAEPLRVLAHLRMIGRALERDVERDLEPVPSAPPSTKRSKSSSVPRPGSIAVCPPSSAPIAHGLPGSPGAGVERVVAPFAEAAADRMDRRQVERRRSPSTAMSGRRAAASSNVALRVRIAAGRAREHLVPRAEPRALALDRSRASTRSYVARADRRAAIASSSSSASRACSSSALAARHRCQRPAAIVVALPRARRGFAISSRLRAARSRRPGRLDLDQLVRHVEAIDPASIAYSCRRRLDGEARRHRSLPSGAIGVFAPRRASPRRPPQQHRREHVVAVGEDVGARRRRPRRACA